MNAKICCGLAVLGSLLGPLAAARAETVVASADTFLTEHGNLGGPSSTHGSDTSLWSIGSFPFRAFPLIAFDLSPFAGATVVGDATLGLYLRNGLSSGPRPVSIHAVLLPWDESTTSWNTFGSIPPILGAGPAIDTRPVAYTGSGSIGYVTFTIPTALIQSWIDTPASNLGILVNNQAIVNGQDLVWASRETATPPTLSFSTLSVIPEPSSALLSLMAMAALPLLVPRMRTRLTPRRRCVASFNGNGAPKPRIPAILLVVALIGLGPLRAEASTLLAYDGFDYTSARLSGNNGGDGLWTGAWAAQGESNLLSTPPTNLNYASGDETLVTAGSSVQSVGGFQQVDSRPWDTSGRFAEGNAIWFSTLINITSGIDFRFWAISANTSVFNGVGLAAFGSTISGRIIGADEGQISGTSGLGLVSGQDHFVVGRIGFEAGSLITLNVWLDPDLGSTPSLADSVSTSRVMPTVSESSWRFALIRSGTRAPNDFRVDEVRIGTDYSSVSPFTSTAIPEPSSLAMSGLATLLGLGWFVRRRKGLSAVA